MSSNSQCLITTNEGRLPPNPRRVCAFALLFLFSTSSALLAQAQPAPQTLVHVDIVGLHSDKGKVLCALFSSANGFPKKSEMAIARRQSEISNRHATCEFSVVAAGTYAVSVFHDENDNGKLDTNFMGIPREGVGASNNAHGHLGPPKFDAAAFHVAGERVDLKIVITYL